MMVNHLWQDARDVVTDILIMEEIGFERAQFRATEIVAALIEQGFMEREKRN